MEKVKQLALLRLVASMLGVKFDDLRQREHERRRHKQRTSAALAATVFLVIFGGGLSYWQMVHPKVAYYRQLVWRWGLPEGAGLIDKEMRDHRFQTYKVTTQRPGIMQSPRVVEVDLENSAGQLSGGGPSRLEDGAYVRWVVRYREDGSLEKIEIFDRVGHRVREETLWKDPLHLVIASRSETARHELKFDEKGFIAERYYLTQSLERRSDARGSFGQRATHSPEGLVQTRVEIGSDNKPVTLNNGQSAVVIKYDENLDPVHYGFTGSDGRPISGPAGFAFFNREFDRWGNETVITYYGTDGNAVLLEDGYAKITKQYDERGNLIVIAHYGTNGNAVLHKGGYAKIRNEYDDRGHVIAQMYLGFNDKPVQDADGVAKYTNKYDGRGYVIEEAYFGLDGKPTLHKDGYSKFTVRYDRHGLRQLTFRDLQDREIPIAVLVETVLPGSQAERIGIQQGDHLNSYDGQKLSSFQHLIALVDKARIIGSRVLTVQRKSETINFNVQPGTIGVRLRNVRAN
jgi:hypothetical protein